jgi:hypothetical protein
VGVEPDGAEAGGEFGLGELGEEDAVGSGVGEGEVGLAGEGEVGEALDGVADVHGDEEGRPTFGGGECLGVALGLVVGVDHGFVPAVGAADGGSATRAGGAVRRVTSHPDGWGRVGEGLGGGLECGRVAALLGFEDEVGSALEADASLGDGVVKIAEDDGLLEDVGIAVVFGLGGVGTGDFEEVAELGEEDLVVGTLGGGGVLPAGEERVRGIGHRSGTVYGMGLGRGWRWNLDEGVGHALGKGSGTGYFPPIAMRLAMDGAPGRWWRVWKR